jgi:Ran GTPase-activating protein (RanGAP) involved in mRNA processing and transport
MVHLNLFCNGIGPDGSESFAGVLTQYTSLTHLHLYNNYFGTTGTESFVGVLAQCPALADLNLDGNDMGTVGEGRLRVSWCGQVFGLVL